MAADVGLQKLWLFEGKRKKYFVFVRYKVQDNFCLTTYDGISHFKTNGCISYLINLKA
jgi:hypothetical protein